MWFISQDQFISNDFVEKSAPDTACTAEQIYAVMEGSLAVIPLPRNPFDDVNIAGTNFDIYLEKYNKRKV